MNLVIHELLTYVPVKPALLQFLDWGSQSIAQSKFQRADSSTLATSHRAWSESFFDVQISWISLPTNFRNELCHCRSLPLGWLFYSAWSAGRENIVTWFQLRKTFFKKTEVFLETKFSKSKEHFSTHLYLRPAPFNMPFAAGRGTMVDTSDCSRTFSIYSVIHALTTI